MANKENNGKPDFSKEDSEQDVKSVFEEKRELNEDKKNLLRKQQEFEYGEVQGAEIRKEEERKDLRKEWLIKIIVGASIIILLGLLYFWLLV
ncbi:MAG: hypothetical protein KKB62_00355 [Nanoarchaeota archaeon]|nr:hypothetical protein [Nanoarchaeota archaeon]